MSDRVRPSLLIAALLGGLLGSATTLAAAVFLLPLHGEPGPAGPHGPAGPAGPAGAPATPLDTAELRDAIPDLTGSYVIEGVSCPKGTIPSRTVKIPGDQFTVGETLQLCYFGPSAR
ncbi:hypothetical protein OG585_09095 [Streptomyces sp. NBC_01340]|uniref:hypothetical protein n=1 Tax=Streptomyces sp. NBC_01340 TaxID=2903830 RepID=UPI002E156D39|nr:hypothetical protein OG585_09095 [Streptomyces sp. NBC_01340]